ncbi:hypothetical protein ACOZE4_19715 [Streptomyces griseoincarnatus]
MLAQRSRDTAPELALRRVLHGLGFRYRVDLPIPGMRRRRADVTFVKWRTAVFVQGCFWHACTRRCTTGSGGGRSWRATSGGTRTPKPTSSGWGGAPAALGARGRRRSRGQGGGGARFPGAPAGAAGPGRDRAGKQVGACGCPVQVTGE